ncbi:hypothetical protein G6162_003536 [Salmonella enterica]|uniref:Uncharacterized protein n=1 Tax=Salmonella arizonae (strain ATCC BAA-731 / CDC346-86 / RSK2980) TaxID=41514 RepID=A9MMH3_SALAR|nr:hypothetical protein SARI_00929 [Salmonella enterica subsp. arizonae serovar 62:z4,z23:-]EDZ3530831.1 hypothetical protein [Salmonella enterica subsp. arizonae]EEA5325357.1 hypothetical protein [Salmonella enterica]EJU7777336.1 hypothetical protein [Salmonella enterica subsp. arizonae serovar 6,7:g,z51:-]EEF3105319.1 hypothetical protein [Salmonella enterica]
MRRPAFVLTVPVYGDLAERMPVLLFLLRNFLSAEGAAPSRTLARAASRNWCALNRETSGQGPESLLFLFTKDAVLNVPEY